MYHKLQELHHLKADEDARARARKMAKLERKMQSTKVDPRASPPSAQGLAEQSTYSRPIPAP